MRRRDLLQVLAAGLLAPAFAPIGPPQASPGLDLRGVALGLFASNPHYDYAHLLDELVQLGATDVLLVVPLYQGDVRATAIAPLPGHSPAPTTVRRTLAQCQARGLRSALMPIVRLGRRTPTEWRGVLDPADVDAWFAAWTAVVVEHARMARDHGSSRLVIGSEFVSLQRHAERWRQLARTARRSYRGRLVYAANWDAYDDIAYWDAIDEIGISGYFRLTPPGHRTDRAGTRQAWVQLLRRLDAFAQERHRPWLLTEVGWPALASAASHPWDDTHVAEPDPTLQATLWSGFLDAIDETARPGHPTPFYAWNWFGHDPPRNPGFGLRGRPASRVLREHFRARTSGTGP